MHHDNNNEERNQPAEEMAPSREVLPADGPRIYVASLSDYNSGILHGRWLEAAVEPDELWEGINEMLAASPTTRRSGEPAEEWAIHDYEGFSRFVALGEYEAIERVAVLARGIVAYGEAFAAWWAMDERDDEDWGDIDSQFEEHYLGEWGSIEDYGTEMLADMGVDIDELPGVPDGLRPYVRIDVEGWTRDMQLGGEISAVESTSGVYVFWVG